MWGRVRIPRPTYFAANIRTRWHGKTPRQPVKGNCSCRGLPELLKKRSPPYARPQHGVSFCGGSDSPCQRDVIDKLIVGIS